MNHGNYYDDDDDDADINNLPPTGSGAGRGANNAHAQPFAGYPAGFGGRGGPLGGILGHVMGGGGFGLNMGSYRQAAPSSFNEYYKAYSVAMMPGKERMNLSYGGKIIMPPSALANLTQLDLPGPWTFHLRNPKNPTLLQTHAGVLEFIADEGHVYMPAWMMKTLQLNEGDPIRLTGASVPKGKFVKLQAQHPDFVEVSDPKAVLESALRNFSVLTNGDIIEIQYNSLTFEFLVMEIKPEGPGISLIDTDLEVDFERPKGYKTPPRPAPIALPTMADKLKIDLNSTTAASASSTRPSSAASNRPGDLGPAGTGSGSDFESFKGAGATLNGRLTKGKGKAKQIEEVDKFSKIARTDKPRVVTNDSIANDGRLVPAPLILPPNQIFVGYKYVPFDPEKVVKKPGLDDGASAQPKPSFVGSGATLSGRAAGSTSNAGSAATPKSPAEEKKPAVDHWASLSGGTSLAASSAAARRPGTASAPIEVDMDEDGYESSEYDFGAGDDDEDDAIVIDSD